MGIIIKLVLYPLLVLIIGIVGYVLFLWASTIHDTVTEGSNYGFTIGKSKHETYQNVIELKEDYPNLVIYTYVSSSTSAQKKHIKLKHDFEHLKLHKQWRIYFKGDGEYSNSIRLNFDNDKLINFYRHRQFYELP